MLYAARDDVNVVDAYLSKGLNKELDFLLLYSNRMREMNGELAIANFEVSKVNSQHGGF